MDKIFGPAYRGDPGVPHSGKEVFQDFFFASTGFSIYSWFCPYYWEQCLPRYNYHDLAMCAEQHQWKKAVKQGKRYQPLWNKFMNEEQRTAYYYNWRDYFP